MARHRRRRSRSQVELLTWGRAALEECDFEAAYRLGPSPEAAIAFRLALEAMINSNVTTEMAAALAATRPHSPSASRRACPLRKMAWPGRCGRS